MAHTLADRVKETTATTGTGDFALAGAVNGFLAFSARLSVGDTTWYAANLGTQWEVGLGTLTAATTLQRTTVLASSNGDAVVNFATGPKEVILDFPAFLCQLLVGFGLAESTVASAATVDLGAQNSRRVAITGTTAITSFGTRPLAEKLLRFTGACMLTHNATSLILPGAASIATAAGDTALATSDAAGNWRVRHYQRADGSPLSASVGLDSFRTLAIRVAKLEGKAVGLFDYLVDDFQDTSGYDTANSVNANLSGGTIINQSSDANTKALLHFDGANGSTTFSDDAGHTFTAGGAAKLSTTWAAFGTASGAFLNSGDFVGGTSADFVLGAGDFAIELRVRPSSTGAQQCLYENRNSSGGAGLAFQINPSGKVFVQDGVNGTNFLTGSTTLSAGTAYAVAVTRSGGTVRLFVNGALDGSATCATNFTNNSFRLGANYDSSIPGNCYLDEFRQSNVARYTAAYTPAASAFVINSSGNLDLRSVSVPAQAQPSKASILALIKATAGTINLNGTLTASITRTGSVADATQFTLALAGTLAGYNVYEGNGLDISGQPAGTSIRYRIQTADTALGVAVDAVVVQWG